MRLITYFQGLLVILVLVSAPKPVVVYRSVAHLHAAAWLVGRLTFLFCTKIGYIADKVLGGDLVQPG